MPKLTVSLPDGADTSHDLTEDVITVGRVDDNLLQIPDVSVSSHHAQLTLEDGDYVLQDIGSTNGTRVNGRPSAEGENHKLQDGDTIIFGKVTTIYASENPADARPMPEEEEVTAVPAASSVRPADFANASPFQTKKKKKDPIGMAVMALGIVSLLAFAAAVALTFGMQVPS